MLTTLRLFRGFPLAVQLLLVNQLGVNTGFYMLVPYLAIYLGGDLGLSAAVVGLVLGVRNLSQQGLFLVGGSAADRIGARPVIIAGCALRTAGFSLFAFGQTLPLLLAASVLSGLAGALFNPAVRAYIAQEANERRAEAFSLFNVFANTGMLLGPLLGSALLVVDFRTSALTAAALFAVLTAAQALVLPPRAVPRRDGSVFGDWREVLGDRRFLAFTLALVGMFALQNQLYLVLPVAARQATGWEGAVSAVFLVSTGANLLAQVRVTDYLAQRTTRGRAIALGLAVMGAAFLPPILLGALAAPDVEWTTAALRLVPVLCSALLLSFGLMITQPFVLELIPSFGRDELAGTAFGVFYLVSGVIAAGGNAVIGGSLDARWSWLPWVLCLALGLVSAAAVSVLERRGAMCPADEKDDRRQTVGS